MHSAVLDVTPLLSNTMFAFVLADGSVEFRSREGLNPFTLDSTTDDIYTFPRSGFTFPNIGQGELASSFVPKASSY